MSRISEDHVAKCGVEGKCSVPMGMVDFCDRPAYGEQYAEGTTHAPRWWSARDRNGFLVNPHNRPDYAPSLCCSSHGGPSETQIRFVLDGNMWCAFMPGFVNFQESVAGFGETQDLAEADLKTRAAVGNGEKDRG